MTEDQDLTEARARVKEFDLGPVPEIDLAALMRGGHWQRRRLVADRALAIAAVLTLVIGLGFGVTHLGQQPDSAVAPNPTGPTPDVAPTTESPNPTTSAARAADCLASDLNPSVDAQLTVSIGGTQQVVLLFTNNGTSACWLSGFPALAGDPGSGATSPLTFQTSSDPTIADPSPARGPGSVAPGQTGALHLTLDNRDCTTTAPHFTQLHIGLPSGQRLTMPFPAELQITSCWRSEAQLGPVVSDAATDSPSPTDSQDQQATVAATAAQVARFLGTGGRLCSTSDLRAQFRNGEEGAGNLLTSVYVGNVSATACALNGPVSLVGLDKAGRAVTPISQCSATNSVAQPCAAPAILPFHATFTDLATNNTPQTLYDVITVVGFYRDDPQSPNGLCTPAHTVTPYTLRLTFGKQTIDVRNWDPANTSLPAGIHAVFACYGAIHF